MKINYGVNHLPFKKKPEDEVTKVVKNTSQQIARSHSIATNYDLDFHSDTFGDIRIKELHTNTDPKDIQLFFQELEKANDVLITVKDADFPCIDEKSFIILEFGKHTRKLHARFFRAILSKEKKAPYIKNHDDHFERLTGLFADAGKGIEVEDY